MPQRYSDGLNSMSVPTPPVSEPDGRPRIKEVDACVIARFEATFRNATGIVISVLSSSSSELPGCNCEFCRFMTQTVTGSAACQAMRTALEGRSISAQTPQEGSCFAGLSELVIPIIRHGHHVGSIWTEQVFRRTPNERDFRFAISVVNGEILRIGEEAVRTAYFSRPVISPERMNAIAELLRDYARQIAHPAHYLADGAERNDPPAVTRAKYFIGENIGDQFTLRDIVQHAHMSRFHFCRVFKKTTGMTVREYVMQLRLKHAEQLLEDQALRITEIAEKSGFGSLSRFNHLFKQKFGVSPTEHRKRDWFTQRGAPVPHESNR